MNLNSKVLTKNLILVFGTIAILSQTSCRHEHQEHKEQTKFVVTSPIRLDTTTTKEYVCQIRAIQHIELRALERGYLQKIFVDEGQYVKKGQLMFQIMPIQYQAEYQKARAEADYAKIEFENAQLLADSNVIAPTQLALVKAKYEKAKAELQLAQVHLGFTKITAPFDGIMDRFQVRLGSLLEDGDLLSTLSDNTEMWVYFNVPEAEYLDYVTSTQKDSAMQVHLRMANNQLFKYTGEVKTIEADFNNETGNIAFRATFPNPDRLLRHGETGNVITKKVLKNALIIPQKATYEVLDKKYVFVIGKDNVVKSRNISIEAEMPDLYAISTGLKEDEKILLEGLRIVREGEKISYDFEDPREVISHLKVHAE